MRRFKFIVLSTAFAVMMSQAEHIKEVQAVTQVFGDGENLSAVVLEYDKPILSSSVSKDDYTVANRDISKVYVSTKSNLNTANAKIPKSGKYVIIELMPLAMIDSSVDPHPEDKANRAKRNAMGENGPTLGSRGNPQPLKTFSASVTQTGKIINVNGEIYTEKGEFNSTNTRELVIEDFIQDVFVDQSQNSAKLMYNLFIPKNYDPKKSYPLVLFMHDAGTVSPQIKSTLVQGLGAVAWADPAWQTEHPSFILAPQYDTIIVNDKFQYGQELERTINLIKYLSSRYNFDMKRIYNTGQSMGGMASIQMDIDYPDFFAASYIIASKWDANITSPLGSQNVFFVASQGDKGAYPSTNEITQNLQKDGVCVKKLILDASDKRQIDERIKAMLEPSCHIYYVIYTGGSHRHTWQHAYSMKAAMEWIFSRRKT